VNSGGEGNRAPAKTPGVDLPTDPQEASWALLRRPDQPDVVAAQDRDVTGHIDEAAASLVSAQRDVEGDAQSFVPPDPCLSEAIELETCSARQRPREGSGTVDSLGA